MKFRSAIFFTFLFLISISVFGQKTEIVKPDSAKPSAVNKPPEAAKLPSAKEILEKYVAAIGGRTANEKIKTRVTKSAFELVPMGIKGTTEIYVAAPDKSYIKTNFQGIGDAIIGYDGKTGWTISPLQGDRDITGEQLLQLKLTTNLHREVNLDKLYTNWTVKGIEKIGQKDVYVIVGTPEGLAPETFYFDRETGLLVRADATLVSPEGKMPLKTFYEDYREIDGIKLSYKKREVSPQFEIITTTTEIKHGAAIEESKFAKPKQ